MKWLAIFLLLLLAFPAWAQNPYAQDDPRAQRGRRELAVARVPEARSLVEAFGDDGCAAIFTCSPDVGKKLAEWHSSGELSRKIPRPRDLLRVIGQGGDEVALFAMQTDLSDSDACMAFLESPLHYTCRIKSLAQGAAEVRARRFQAEAAKVPFERDTNAHVLIIGIAGLIILWLWWKRRQYGSGVA